MFSTQPTFTLPITAKSDDASLPFQCQSECSTSKEILVTSPVRALHLARTTTKDASKSVFSLPASLKFKAHLEKALGTIPFPSTSFEFGPSAYSFALGGCLQNQSYHDGSITYVATPLLMAILL
jgi:hypothetical protein